MPVSNNVPERKSVLRKVFNFNTLSAGVAGGLGGAALGYYIPHWGFQLGMLALSGGVAAAPVAVIYATMASAAVFGSLSAYWNMKAVGWQTTLDDKKKLYSRNKKLIALSTIGGLAAGISLAGPIGAAVVAATSNSVWLGFLGAGLHSVSSTLIPAVGAVFGAAANYANLNWNVKEAAPEEKNDPKAPDAKKAGPVATPA